MFSEVYCIVSGKVQGVGFRAFVESVAREHSVTGWVRNDHKKGTVEIVFQGIPDVLKECIEDLHRGSVLSRIESIAVDWRSPQKLFDDFKVIASA